MRFSCGIIFGFILTVLAAAAAFYYFWLRDDPELQKKSIQQIEEKWDDAKDSGDKILKNIKK